MLRGLLRDKNASEGHTKGLDGLNRCVNMHFGLNQNWSLKHESKYKTNFENKIWKKKKIQKVPPQTLYSSTHAKTCTPLAHHTKSEHQCSCNWLSFMMASLHGFSISLAGPKWHVDHHGWKANCSDSVWQSHLRCQTPRVPSSTCHHWLDRCWNVWNCKRIQLLKSWKGGYEGGDAK